MIPQDPIENAIDKTPTCNDASLARRRAGPGGTRLHTDEGLAYAFYWGLPKSIGLTTDLFTFFFRFSVSFR